MVATSGNEKASNKPMPCLLYVMCVCVALQCCGWVSWHVSSLSRFVVSTHCHWHYWLLFFSQIARYNTSSGEAHRHPEMLTIHQQNKIASPKSKVHSRKRRDEWWMMMISCNMDTGGWYWSMQTAICALLYGTVLSTIMLQYVSFANASQVTWLFFSMLSSSSPLFALVACSWNFFRLAASFGQVCVNLKSPVNQDSPATVMSQQWLHYVLLEEKKHIAKQAKKDKRNLANLRPWGMNIFALFWHFWPHTSQEFGRAGTGIKDCDPSAVLGSTSPSGDSWRWGSMGLTLTAQCSIHPRDQAKAEIKKLPAKKHGKPK